MRTRNALLAAGCLLSLAAATSSPLAHQIFVTSTSDERISVIDASGQPIPFTGDTGLLSGPAGIAIDGAGAIFVADRLGNRILRYEADGSGPQVVVAKLPGPDGLSVGRGGDLFLVGSPTATTRILADRESGTRLTRLDGDLVSPMLETTRSVYLVPAGTGNLVKIADIPESRDLRETAIVRGGSFADNLLVLSANPGFVARFSRGQDGLWSRQADLIGALPGPASGMAITDAGELLVSGTQGTIWRYDGAGQRMADFATGLAWGATRLAVDHDDTVYLANRNQPAIGRFDRSGSRLPDLAAGIQAPVALAVQGSAPTPVGTNVTVALIPGLSVVFDRVVSAGFTTADQEAITDTEQRVTPCGNVLPSHIQPPSTGPFLVTRIETTALYTDTIEVIQDHPDGEARLFRAACPPDGAGFSENTTLAIPGDPRGRVISFSEFVVGRDTRANPDVVQDKLVDLQNLVGPDSPAEQLVDSELLFVIRGSINLVRVQIQEELPDRAMAELQELIAFVRQFSGEGIPNIDDSESQSVNVAGGLQALSATLKFSLSFEPTPWSEPGGGED